MFAGLLGAIAWNVFTWYFGLPSSSSHALIGGVIGATAVAAGLGAIEAPQGFCAETASAAVLLISTHGGVPLSTTQITTGSVVGSGLGKRAAEVHWGVAGRMVGAWVLTIPAAAAVAALVGAITKNGNAVGIVVVTVVAAALLLRVWLRSRRNAVTANNVNDVPASRPVAVPVG